MLLNAAGDDEPTMAATGATVEDGDPADDEGTSWMWLWAIGALVLLGVAP